MLFLINHVEDACRYLQAQGLWKESCIFAKVSLNLRYFWLIEFLLHHIFYQFRKKNGSFYIF